MGCGYVLVMIHASRREGFSACVVHGLFNELALHCKSQLCSRVPLGIRTSALTRPCQHVGLLFSYIRECQMRRERAKP